MNVKIFLFVFVCIPSMDSINDIRFTKAKMVSKSRFQAPMDIHLLQTVTGVQSLIMCGVLCDRHSYCRTADFDSTQKVCRLFESALSAGTYLADPTTSIISIDYCDNDKTEPEYVCTRSGTFTVQQIFNQIALIPNITLSTINRGAYANMYGVYASTTTGQLSFFNYTGIKTILANVSGEITNVNSVSHDGLAIVQYYSNVSIIYKNIGSPSQPMLVPILNFTLSGHPYTCVATSEYLYVAYTEGYIVMTIHNLSTGSILRTVSRNSSITFRPVVTQWKDTIIILDECTATEYNLTGVYKGTWSYFNGTQINVRNYMHHDYAGRRYICNGGGTNPGIYVFLQNGTKIAYRPGKCYRAFQLYLTKDQAMFTNVPDPDPATMQKINF